MIYIFKKWNKIDVRVHLTWWLSLLGDFLLSVVCVNEQFQCKNSFLQRIVANIISRSLNSRSSKKKKKKSQTPQIKISKRKRKQLNQERMLHCQHRDCGSEQLPRERSFSLQRWHFPPVFDFYYCANKLSQTQRLKTANVSSVTQPEGTLCSGSPFFAEALEKNILPHSFRLLAEGSS